MENALNYLLLFYYSLEKHAKQCYEVEAVRMLFNLDFSKEVFLEWYELRKDLLEIAGREDDPELSLTKVLIKRKDIQIIAESMGEEIWEELHKWIKQKENLLKKLRAKARHGDREARALVLKNKKLFLVGKTCAAPLAFRIIQIFMAEDVALTDRDKILAEEVSKRQREAERKVKIEDASKEEDDGEEEDEAEKEVEEQEDNYDWDEDDGLGAPTAVVAQPDPQEEEANQEEQASKQELVDDINIINRNIRSKKESMILLLSFIRSMDSLNNEAYTRINKSRTKLNGYKKLVVGDEQRNLMARIQGGAQAVPFFEQGSEVDGRIYKNVCKHIEGQDFEESYDMINKSRIYNGCFNGFRNICRKLMDMDKKLYRKKQDVLIEFFDEPEEEQQDPDDLLVGDQGGDGGKEGEAEGGEKEANSLLDEEDDVEVDLFDDEDDVPAPAEEIIPEPPVEEVKEEVVVVEETVEVDDDDEEEDEEEEQPDLPLDPEPGADGGEAQEGDLDAEIKAEEAQIAADEAEEKALDAEIAADEAQIEAIDAQEKAIEAEENAIEAEGAIPPPPGAIPPPPPGAIPPPPGVIPPPPGGAPAPAGGPPPPPPPLILLDKARTAADTQKEVDPNAPLAGETISIKVIEGGPTHAEAADIPPPPPPIF